MKRKPVTLTTLAALVLELDGALDLVPDASAVEVATESWQRLVDEARRVAGGEGRT
jgi:hypothetical protein